MSRALATSNVEQHARIIKLPAGGWRVWWRDQNIRVYGTTRDRAVCEAASRLLQRPPYDGSFDSESLRFFNQERAQ